MNKKFVIFYVIGTIFAILAIAGASFNCIYALVLLVPSLLMIVPTVISNIVSRIKIKNNSLK